MKMLVMLLMVLGLAAVAQADSIVEDTAEALYVRAAASRSNFAGAPSQIGDVQAP